MPTARPAPPRTAASAEPAPPRRRDFVAYLGGSALWLGGFNLQQFLVTWMLVGMLMESGARVGAAQLAIAVPGFVLMLLGGSAGDRSDGRRLLLRAHALATLAPLALIAALGVSGLTYAVVIGYGMAVSVLAGFSEPGRAALLNRVARGGVQQKVVLTTGVSTLVGVGGTWLGGRVDAVGLQPVLTAQAVLFLAGGLAVAAIRPDLGARTVAPAGGSQLQQLTDGLRVLWHTPLVRDLIGLNFVSAVFNAGAWFVVYPFLVTRLYAGDAALLAGLAIAFFTGSVVSQLGLLPFLPLARPGRLFLSMQLTRVVLLGVLIAEPPLWLLAAATVGWGMNMGLTSSTARLIVQTEAPEAHRARLLSVFILGTMTAAPLGSVLLGTLVDLAGVRSGFVPGLIASLAIFALGMIASDLWWHGGPTKATPEAPVRGRAG